MAALPLALVLALVGCRSDVGDRPTNEAALPEPATPTLQVAATSWPVAWLVEQLAGDAIAWAGRSVLDLDPASSPSAEEILELAEAELVLIHGLDLESWIATAALPESRMVVTTQGIEAIEIEGPTHSHGPEGEHSHRSADPRTWTDPLLYLEQAQHVHEALAAAAPELGQASAERLASLGAELEALDQRLATLLSQPTVSWASAGGLLSYLSRRHRREAHSFGLTPRAPLDDHELGHLRRWAAAEENPILVWDTAPGEEVLAAMPEKLSHVVFDPLLTAPAEGYGYLERMSANVERLSEVMPRAP